MDWTRVAESLIGTFAGGFIAVGSIWLKEILDRQRGTQAWYEQYYVAEGIAPLRSYFMMVEMQLVDLHSGAIEISPLPTVPYEAITRIVCLLDCRGLLAVVTLLTKLGKQYQSREYVWDCIGMVKMVGAHLDDLSSALSSKRIRAKAQVNSLAGSPEIARLRNRLEEDVEARVQEMDAFFKRHPEL